MNGLIVFVFIGLIAGWLAGVFMKGSGFGILGDIVIGIVGAVIGGYLIGIIGISAGGFVGSIVVATIGAIILIFLVRLLKKA
ncbi:GlsB/YeaQ/YmgE family stress response membrane protein [Maridesulfovibrio zosterae]|uniref:GlsB/YeaQ/YmgE family stress response membrane protein n=1 Tax=Maridesulfovibrio zosterae TaxID=82171 RepID=UPI00040703DD|nr:GlsB/YeaQ/YmgE family stress response membrane protein [Maridesulfovibrio zosterae]